MSLTPSFADSQLAARRVPAVALALLLTISAAACSTAASPRPTAGPSSGPTAGPTAAPTVAGGIEHPTGAQDVVLRVEESGGFAPIEWLATSAPSFTLYGDGTVVFRDPTAIPPESNDNLVRSVPFQTVRLDEAAIQALLEFAIGPGGLGAAQGPYLGMGADIPTTTFTIDAGGPEPKQVSVNGLSPDLHPQDQLVITALMGLYERLAGFGSQVGGGQPYVAAAYRGVLISADQPFGPVVEWPWDALTPDDFAGEQEFYRTAALTPEDVEALGIPDVEGGFSGISLSTDGKFFTFALRPLLPDESE